MFLVVKKTEGNTARYTFYPENPKDCGYKEAVEEVEFPFPWVDFPNVDMGTLCLGQSKTNGKKYQAFSSKRECEIAGYTPLGSDFMVEPDLMAWKKHG